MAEDEPQSKRTKKSDHVANFCLDVKGVKLTVCRNTLEEQSSVLKKKLNDVPKEKNYLEIQNENPLCVCKCLCVLEERFLGDEDGYIVWPETQYSSVEDVVVPSDVSSLLDLASRWEMQYVQLELFSYLHRNVNTRSCAFICSLAERYKNEKLLNRCTEFMENDVENKSPDFILDVKGVQFFISSSIIMNESAVMRRKLNKMPFKQNHLVIQDENPLCVCKCLCILERRCVTGGHYITWERKTFSSLEKIVRLSDVSAILGLSVRWAIPRVQHEMFQFLREHLTIDTYYRVNSIEESYPNHDLRSHCDLFLAKNFCQLCEIDKFYLLNEDRILTALKSKDFKTICWGLVYERLISWLKYDQRRESCFEELFFCVDLSSFAPDYLENHIETNELVKSNAACLERVHKAFRHSYERSVGLIIEGRLSRLKILCPFVGRSIPLEPFSTEQDVSMKYSMIVFSNHVYVFWSNQSVFRLGLKTHNAIWEKLVSTNDYHEEKPHAAVVKDELFVLGGGKVMINTCEKFLSEHKVWKRISILNMDTENYNIVTVEEFIYIIGVKRNGIKLIPSAEKYSPSDGSLIPIQPTILPMCDPSTTSTGQLIYVAGSVEEDALHSLNIECLDTEAGTWTRILYNQSDDYYISCMIATQTSIVCHGQEPVQQHDQHTFGVRLGETCTELLTIPTICHHVKNTSVRDFHHLPAGFCSLFLGAVQSYDIIIKVSGKEFPAHKSVLSRFSDYFKAMFRCDMIEKEASVVELMCMDSLVIRKCLDYLYGAWHPDFTFENIEPFLNAATYMQLTGLLFDVYIFMKAHLSCNTFGNFKRLTHKYCFFEMEDICDDYAIKNYKEIISVSPTLEKDYLLFLLQNRGTEESNEFGAYNAIVQWVKHGHGTRDRYFAELFNFLNLVKIPESIVQSDVVKEKLVKDSAFCLCKVEDSTRKRKELYDVLCLFRRVPNRIERWDFLVYCPRLEKWKTIWENGHLPHKQLISLGECLYCLTPEDGTVHKLEYQKTNATWEVMTFGDKLYYIYKTAVTEDCLYFVTFGSIGQYNILQNEWHSFHIHIDREYFAVAAAGKRIYFFGGIDPEEIQSLSTLCYDIESQALVEGLSDMMHARCDAAAVHFDGKIFVTGGWYTETDDYLASVEVYNISNNSWTSLPEMNFPRSDHAAVFIDGSLYVVGGDPNTPHTMEYFNEDERTWKIEVIPIKPNICVTYGQIPYELLC